jgi:hypothetical protein
VNFADMLHGRARVGEDPKSMSHVMKIRDIAKFARRQIRRGLYQPGDKKISGADVSRLEFAPGTC